MAFRTRVQGIQLNSKYTRQDFDANGIPDTVVTLESARKYFSNQKSITDVVTPSFKKKIAAGNIIMNPLTLTNDQRSCTQHSLTFGPIPIWGRREFKGTMACEWAVPPVRPSWYDSRVSDARAATLVSAYDKVGKTDATFFVTVAEARKTAKGLREPFAGAFNQLRRIIERKAKLVRAGVHLTKAAAQAWNEYRFGWKPLLYDISNIADAYTASVEHAIARPVRLTVRSRETVEWSEGQQNSVVPPPAGLTSLRMQGVHYHTAKVSSGVIYDLHDENVTAAVLRTTGLRLSDVPAAIWELVPYSFIVDRFAHVGKWLNAITPMPGVRVLSNWTTVVSREMSDHWVTNANIHVELPDGNGTFDLNASGGLYHEEIQGVSRTTNNLLPLIPPINHRELSLEQSIDHLALLSNGFNLARQKPDPKAYRDWVFNWDRINHS